MKNAENRECRSRHGGLRHATRGQGVPTLGHRHFRIARFCSAGVLRLVR